LSNKEFIGNFDTEKVYEQKVCIHHEDNPLMLRLISIELDKLTRNNNKELLLFSKINALGYPKAALFGFCMALVAFNILDLGCCSP
jgi:hypothetical protein